MSQEGRHQRMLDDWPDMFRTLALATLVGLAGGADSARSRKNGR
jgi:hypothetical protein